MATKKTTKLAENIEASETAKKAVDKKVQRRIPLDIEVPCVCNTKGQLGYISSRSNGINADWDEFGSVQYLDLRELVNMRNTQKRFFNDNWIVLRDTDDGEFTADEIYKFLRVDDKYGSYYDCDNIETFFDLSPKQMKEKVATLSDGIKELLTIMACDKFESGEIDSIKKTQAIKDALGIKDDEGE